MNLMRDIITGLLLFCVTIIWAATVGAAAGLVLASIANTGIGL